MDCSCCAQALLDFMTRTAAVLLDQTPGKYQVGRALVCAHIEEVKPCTLNPELDDKNNFGVLVGLSIEPRRDHLREPGGPGERC